MLWACGFPEEAAWVAFASALMLASVAATRASLSYLSTSLWCMSNALWCASDASQAYGGSWAIPMALAVALMVVEVWRGRIR